MRFLFLAPCLLLSTVLFAETYRYIAFADKFKAKTDDVVFSPDDKVGQTKALNEFGKSGQPQPSENTQFIIVKNTDVAFLEISFKDDTEKTLYEKMAGDGRLYLFNISETVNEGGIVKVRHTFERPIPVDINKDWSVVASSK